MTVITHAATYTTHCQIQQIARACAKMVGTGLVRIQTAKGNEGANFYLYVYWEL